MQTTSQTITTLGNGSAVAPSHASTDAQPRRAHSDRPRPGVGDARAASVRPTPQPAFIAAGIPAATIGTAIVGDFVGKSVLELADGVTPGATVYIDGRFYRCIDRLRLGGDGSFDIVQVTRLTFGPDAEAPFGIITVQLLTDLEVQGRAALVASRKPGSDFAVEAPSPAGPMAPSIAAVAAAAAMRMS